MATVKLNIEGLAEFKQVFKDIPSFDIAVPDVSIAILKVHNVLEDRISKLYFTPGRLSDVLLGKSVKPINIGKTFLTYGLQYRERAVPLAQYPFTESSLFDSGSKAPLRRGGKSALTAVHWKSGAWSKRVTVKIRKGRSAQGARRGGNASKLRGFFTGTNIKAREQQATWLQQPTLGVSTGDENRAPYSTLYGPSLATLAQSLWEKDVDVQNAVEKVSATIIDSFINYYNKV